MPAEQPMAEVTITVSPGWLHHMQGVWCRTLPALSLLVKHVCIPKLSGDELLCLAWWRVGIALLCFKNFLFQLPRLVTTIIVDFVGLPEKSGTLKAAVLGLIRSRRTPESRCSAVKVLQLFARVSSVFRSCHQADVVPKGNMYNKLRERLHHGGPF